MGIDKAIAKSWIEKRIHGKAVKRYENEINQAYNDLRDSVVGKLAIKNLPKCKKPLKVGDDSCHDFKSKEEVFSAIFEGYDAFKKRTIEDYEQEETDAIIKAIRDKGVIPVFCRLLLDPWRIKK